jgi:hypothetical protein
VERAPDGQQVEVPTDQWAGTVRHDMERAQLEEERKRVTSAHKAMWRAFRSSKLDPGAIDAIRAYGWEGPTDAWTPELNEWVLRTVMQASRAFMELSNRIDAMGPA